MGLLRHSIRFTIAALATAIVVAPASAAEAPSHLEPGPSRQPTNHATQFAAWDLWNLSIPAIDVSEPIRAGVSLDVLDQGVGYWSGTAQPGGDGNLVLAGHRTTFTRPFEDLDRLVVGDLITVEDGFGHEIRYRVSESMVVEPNDMWITFDRPTPTLTLFACHPKGSAAFRIVVVADLISRHPMA